MPNYQFTCVECEDTVDVFFPITEKHQEVVCETCGNKRIKQISFNAVAFKGGGWAHKE